METYQSKTAPEALAGQASDGKNGLSLQEAKQRLEKFGENKLTGKPETPLYMLFLRQFKDFLVLILMVAAVISIGLGEYIDGVVILAIVVLNAVLGVYQENKASNALKALKAMASPHSKVVRDGVVMEIPSNEVVPGDIVRLDAGDYVPADLRLIESMNLKIDEAALTGESVPVEKDAAAVTAEDAGIGDWINCAFMSSVVTYGRGKGVVTGTGMKTQMGKIAAMLDEQEEGTTPLQQKLDNLGKVLGVICIAVCVIIFGLGFFRGDDIFQIFMTAVSLAVAAIPEGLTVVVTVILAMGMQKMVKSNAIIKRLSACETLGSTTVICSDKTGTLTQNKMTVVKLFDNEQVYNVSGTGYNPDGQITGEDGAAYGGSVEMLLTGAVLCNDSQYDADAAKIIGDPTEGSLLVAGHKIGLVFDTLNKETPRIDEIPFDSDRKLMSTFHKKDEGVVMYTKGAPDEVLRRSAFIYKNGGIEPITENQKQAIADANTGFAKEALRVLAVAFRNLPEVGETEGKEQELVFVGLLGMIDPPREEVKAAIATCKKAGVKVKMITGDHRITACAIARQLGIIQDSDKDDEASMEGRQLTLTSDEELKSKVEGINVYARVSPEHKVRLVSALRENGEIAAMTGDGVNDAPSLKKADIGIAMGITGTDVSKEAADMILTDDNFASIVLAVEEGRTIFNNIRKVVSFLLACNIGEILVIFVAMLLGFPVPLLSIQLLTINLITDAFPAFALGMEEKEPGIMDVAPRDPNAPIVDKSMGVSVAFQSVFLALGTLLSFIYALDRFGYQTATTACFATLVMGELLRAYSARSESVPLVQMKIFGNSFLNKTVLISLAFLAATIYVPFLHPIFGTEFLDPAELSMCVVFAALPVFGSELAKLYKRRAQKKQAQ